ncbi:transketolase [Spiroplasma endosymbiont of Labia minor]|uniref:transketolase n=1 Tax=Spiroplasma endosymbiont of Labia minor TaxID=3066305 RepID=UPI0030CEADEE
MNKNILSINALRMLGVEMVNKAKSGHPGIVLGAAPMLYSLYTNFINIDIENPNWINRDRFVLSAGHGSALLYSMLHLVGFDVTIDDIKKFRQVESKTPGHPEYGFTEGVDATTGPLGQGIAMATGMALAESHLSSIYNKLDYKIIDHFTYVICGDGDLQEGVAQEAISFAGNYKLNKLIILHDSNDIQLDAPVNVAQKTNMQQLFKANDWNTLKVENGEDIQSIYDAISSAKNSSKPTYIEIKTVIGLGSPNQGTNKVHGEPLGNDLDATKKYYDWNLPDFEIPNDIYNDYKINVADRGHNTYLKWQMMFEKYKLDYPELAKQLIDAKNLNFILDEDEFRKIIPKLPQATRVSSGQVLDIISKNIKYTIGGSADLTASTKAKGLDGNFDVNNRSGRNIMYGVREFAMASINNGIALHKGLLPFAGGFFVFSDYMKPAIRLAALMKIHCLYIFTHDSVAVGEDGPTHEPVEQLAMLRSIPNINIFRPADFQETYASYLLALEQVNKPSAIILTRQNLPELEHSDVYEAVSKGAYLISDCLNAKITIIATGSEVSLALKAKEIIEEEMNLKIKIVSMPSMNIFLQQELEYQNNIIDKSTFKVTLEMATTFGWSKFSGDYGFNIGWDEFGFSGPGEKVIEHIGFTPKNIAQKIIDEYKKQTYKK